MGVDEDRNGNHETLTSIRVLESSSVDAALAILHDVLCKEKNKKNIRQQK
tara:strand:- start:16 stop:165 length:150 start_codon:yes stop_codon:yes gene_type:complete